MTASAAGSFLEKMDAIKLHCREKWGTDYEMQLYCIDEQNTSRKKLILILNGIKDNDDLMGIARHCTEKWSEPGDDFYDYEMIEYCFSEQLKAYKTLNDMQ